MTTKLIVIFTNPRFEEWIRATSSRKWGIKTKNKDFLKIIGDLSS